MADPVDPRAEARRAAWDALDWTQQKRTTRAAIYRAVDAALDSVRSSQPGGEGVREIVGYMREAYRQIDHEAGGGEVSAEWVATRLKRWADGLAALSPPEAERPKETDAT
jgi:hypothetical protein